MTTFRELGVHAQICDALERAGITTPFAIQEMTLSVALLGTDLIGQARTGTGKTLAFGIPVLQRSVAPSDPAYADMPQGKPQALIVAPTRPVSSIGNPTLPTKDTLSVAATFLHPGTGEVVDEVVVGDTVEDVPFGSSVSVSPDRTKVAVTSGYATTVLDTRTREVLGRVVLPPVDEPGLDGSPTPEVVWCSAWTPDGSRLLLGAEGPLYSGLGGLVVVEGRCGILKNLHRRLSARCCHYMQGGRRPWRPCIVSLDALTREVAFRNAKWVRRGD